VTGKGTLFDPPDKESSLSKIRDGTSNTICMIEVKSSGINWAEPRDVDFSQPTSLPPGNHPNINLALFSTVTRGAHKKPRRRRPSAACQPVPATNKSPTTNETKSRVQRSNAVEHESRILIIPCPSSYSVLTAANSIASPINTQANGPVRSCGKPITIPLPAGMAGYAYAPQPPKVAAVQACHCGAGRVRIGGICVIGILVALLLPAVASGPRGGSADAIQNNLKQIVPRASQLTTMHSTPFLPPS